MNCFFLPQYLTPFFQLKKQNKKKETINFFSFWNFNVNFLRATRWTYSTNNIFVSKWNCNDVFWRHLWQKLRKNSTQRPKVGNSFEFILKCFHLTMRRIKVFCNFHDRGMGKLRVVRKAEMWLDELWREETL